MALENGDSRLGVGKSQSTYHCLEVFNIPAELMVVSRDPSREKSRYKAIKKLVRTRVGPFSEGELAGQAEISFMEELAVVLFTLVVLGGPLFLFLVLVPFTAVFGSWHHWLALVLTILLLALHPLPSVDYNLIRSSWFTFALYKYFSYRYVWCDDDWERLMNGSSWIAASAPHGVLPFAQILSMMAVNSLCFSGSFFGAPASIVMRTPFLRYMLLGGPFCEVSAKTITREVVRGNCVGIVADGIAGMFCCKEEIETVYLKSRKGISRLCLRTGTSVMPSYILGNNQCFSAWFDPLGIMERVSRKTKASFLLFWGRYGLPIPRRIPITHICGSLLEVPKAIDNPSQKLIDDLHQKLLDGLQNIFDLHKAAAGYSHKRMKFV